MSSAREQASSHLEAHGRSIDGLHHRLEEIAGADKARLKSAVEKYKAAHRTFSDDVLGCMN